MIAPEPTNNNYGKAWEHMTPAERAAFFSYLNQPHKKLDAAIEARQARDAQEEIEPASFIDFAPEFLSIEDPVIEYLLPELTPPGVIKNSHGDPRSMKTLGAIEEAVALATMTDAFGLPRFRPPRKYKVWFCSQEDAAPVTRARFKGVLLARGIEEFPANLAFSVYKGIDFDNPAWQARFYEQAVYYGFEHITIDPMRAFTANADKGPAEVLPIAKFFRRLTVRGVVIHVVHHDVKPPSNGPDTRRRSHRASGGGWFSVSECPVAFEKICDGQALISPEDYKFSSDPQPFTITYNETEDDRGRKLIRLIGENSTADEAKTLAIDEKVLTYLAENPGKSGSGLATALRARKYDVLDSLERCFKANKVDYLEKGRAKLWSRKASV